MSFDVHRISNRKFGVGDNAGGRLPVSWYPESYTNVSMLDMGMRPDPSRQYPGRTYRYYTGATVYEFGDGLSYTDFSHSHAVIPPTDITIPGLQQLKCFLHPHLEDECALAASKVALEGEATCEDASFFVRVLVKNEGVKRGTDVVLLYAMPPNRGVDGRPLKNLVGFQRVTLDAEAEAEVAFHVLPCRHLAVVGDNGVDKVVNEGVHTFVIGNTNKLPHTILFHL
jgi:beta-D-xylosidase 4